MNTDILSFPSLLEVYTMKRGPTAEDSIEDIQREISSLDKQLQSLKDDGSDDALRSQLETMKAFQINRIKKLKRTVKYSAPDASSSTAEHDSPSGSPTRSKENSPPRPYYESAQMAAQAAAAAGPSPSMPSKTHVLGRKMGKAVQEGMALFEAHESKASINVSVLNAIEFLETMENIFKSSFGSDYNLYKNNGPIDLNLRGIQTEGVEASTSGRLFARTDYFIKAHDDKPKSFGTIDTLKGQRKDGSPFHFESDFHVQVLKEMIASNKMAPDDADGLLQHIVDHIETDPQWIAFWHQRPHVDEGLKKQILDTFVYKIAGECHKRLIENMPREKQADVDSFMQKLKIAALHFTSGEPTKTKIPRV